MAEPLFPLLHSASATVLTRDAGAQSLALMHVIGGDRDKGKS